MAGIINVDEGLIMHGGRVTYQNSQVWLMEDTILSNILIGRPLNKERLKMVYEVTELDEELKLFLFKERTKLIENLYLSEVQKRKIILARTLYTEAHIFLLDSPFREMPLEVSSRIMANIKIYFPHETFIVSTIYPNLAAFDKTLVF